MISERKRPFKFNLGFNNQQNLLILGLVTALQINKSWRPNFYSIFCCFSAPKMGKFEKNQYFELSRVKISKMEDKIKIRAPINLLYYQSL